MPEIRTGSGENNQPLNMNACQKSVYNRKLNDLIDSTNHIETSVEAIRYKELCRLNIRQFGYLHKLCMTGKLRFDDAVDRLVAGATPEDLALEFNLEA